MNHAKPILKLAAAALALLACMTAGAQGHECARVKDRVERLNCFDKAFGVPAQNDPVSMAVPPATGEQASTRTLAQAWDLRTDTERRENTKREHDRGTFELRAYKPMYLLAATHTNRINAQPASQNPANVQVAPLPIDMNEAQFQISFKTKVWDKILGDNGSLWMGYTQSSRWQVYNSGASRPFRETNYEPEAMFVMDTPSSWGDFLGWRSVMAGVSINHQSNGRSRPLSRSWNRLIAQWGLEKGDSMILLRPWWRIPERAADDDNPRIQDYAGRAEVVFAHRFGGHVVSVQGRHSLRTGDNARGSMKLEWSIPLSGYLKAHLSLFSGYGESLIDFNHRQTVVGAGVSLVELR